MSKRNEQAGGGAYWKEEVHNIHGAEDKVGDLRLVVPIAREDQQGRDDVVREHLPVILPPCFNVDHHDLLQPECILRQDVPLAQAIHFPIWPVRPELPEVENVVRLH